MKGYTLDPHPEANAAQQHYAVVFAPKRRARGRFPSNNVTLCDTVGETIEAVSYTHLTLPTTVVV